MGIVKLVTAGLVAATLTGALAPTQALADKRKSWDSLSTALVFGLAGAAEWQTFTAHDTPGQMEFFKTMAATVLLTQGLKAVVHEKRPDGSSNHSFPSGHAAVAFAAASYLDIRYGAQNPGLVPVFYGAAALTALARVEAKKHYLGDVAAGALIGIGFAHLFTTPNADVSVYPTGDGVGVSVTQHF